MKAALAFLLLSGGTEAESAHGFLGIPNTVWQAVNLVAFLGLLVYFLRKPVKGFFAERREGVDKALKKADEDRRRAEELSAQLSARLGQLESELQALKEHARREAEAEQVELAKQTEADVARIVARASVEMESRVRSARAELAGYAGDLAVEVARDILRKGVTAEDEVRLVKEGVAQLSTRVRS